MKEDILKNVNNQNNFCFYGLLLEFYFFYFLEDIGNHALTINSCIFY